MLPGHMTLTGDPAFHHKNVIRDQDFCCGDIIRQSGYLFTVMTVSGPDYSRVPASSFTSSKVGITLSAPFLVVIRDAAAFA